jgi:hypothetical protein
MFREIEQNRILLKKLQNMIDEIPSEEVVEETPAEVETPAVEVTPEEPVA